MSEFVYLFRGGNPSGTPEQLQQQMQKWNVWMKELATKGLMNGQSGRPLEATGKQVKGKQRTVVDGPYAETKDIVGGFMLIEAKDLAEATEAAAGCPVLEGGGLVEVRPTMKIAP